MLFFKRLFKKTRKIQYLKLRYKQIFWTPIKIDLPLQETHSLDYVAESWAVIQPSGLHTHLVFDTATVFSYNEYLDYNKMILRIKQMTVDFDLFPKMERNQDIVKEEWWRLFLNIKAVRRKITRLWQKPLYVFTHPIQSEKDNFNRIKGYKLDAQNRVFAKEAYPIKKKGKLSFRKAKKFVRLEHRKLIKAKIKSQINTLNIKHL